MIAGKKALEVPLRLLDVPAVGQAPALRQPVNVGVDGKGRLAECLGHDDLGCLVSHARQVLQLLKGPGTFPPWFSTRRRESPEIARAFCGASPQEWTIRWIVETGSRAILSGESAAAKRAGVTSFTLLSVHWAERRTATSSV